MNGTYESFVDLFVCSLVMYVHVCITKRRVGNTGRQCIGGEAVGLFTFWTQSVQPSAQEFPHQTCVATDQIRGRRSSRVISKFLVVWLVTEPTVQSSLDRQCRTS
jgi:hypothetical protein